MQIKGVNYRDIAGVDLIKMLARSRELELKRSLDNQEPEREEKTTYFREIVKGVLVLIAGYIGIMLIVGLVR